MYKFFRNKFVRQCESAPGISFGTIGLFSTILIIDQVSKIYVRNLFADKNPGYYISVIGNFFRITFVQNYGAAFGISLFPPKINNIIFIPISIIAIIIIIYLLLKSQNNWMKYSYTFILAGAVGNLIDRIFLGKVTDFLDFDFPDFIVQRWYIFNIADSSIVVGTTILIIYSIFFEKK